VCSIAAAGLGIRTAHISLILAERLVVIMGEPASIVAIAVAKLEDVDASRGSAVW
jgi:hypothetical protein